MVKYIYISQHKIKKKCKNIKDMEIIYFILCRKRNNHFQKFCIISLPVKCVS